MTEAELEAIVRESQQLPVEDLLFQLQKILRTDEDPNRYHVKVEGTSVSGKTNTISRWIVREECLRLGLADRVVDVSKTDAPVESNNGSVQTFGVMWQRLRHHICEEWKFCERRKDFADDIKLVTSLIAFLIPMVGWPVRATAIVVILAVHKGPVFMCNCATKKA